jgi:diacylglycerol kinase (ATP)
MENPRQTKTGLPRLWSALHYSLSGLRAAWQHEQAFRLEALCAAALIPAALLLPVSATDQAILIASILLVLIVELLNSAIESAVDHTSLAQHPLAKRAKDIASAAVLLSLFNAAAIWTLILLLQ